jgi:hypothetical protein
MDAFEEIDIKGPPKKANQSDTGSSKAESM